MRLAGKRLAWDHGLSLLYLTTTTTKIWKKKSTNDRLARHWQEIEKYMHAVEDASIVLTMRPWELAKNGAVWTQSAVKIYQNLAKAGSSMRIY